LPVKGYFKIPNSSQAEWFDEKQSNRFARRIELSNQLGNGSGFKSEGWIAENANGSSALNAERITPQGAVWIIETTSRGFAGCGRDGPRSQH
jgi:hypothetical protein